MRTKIKYVDWKALPKCPKLVRDMVLGQKYRMSYGFDNFICEIETEGTFDTENVDVVKDEVWK